MTKFKTYPVSLTKALVILMIISSAIVALCLNSYLDRAVKQIYSDMNEQLLKNDGEQVSQQIGKYLNQPQASAKLMALLSAGESAAKPASVAGILQQIIELNFNNGQPLSKLSFATANGSYTVLQRDPTDGTFKTIHASAQTNQAVLKQLWFVHARETSQPFWTEHTHRHAAGQGMAMTWRQPVRDRRGSFLGVLSAEIQPEAMSGWLQSLDTNNSHRLMLLNEKGKLIAAASPLSADEIQNAGQHLPSPGRTDSLLRPAVDHNLMLSKAISDAEGKLKWTLVMLTPDNQWQASINRYHQHNFVGLTIFITLALLLITFMMVRFSRPLVSLINHVHLLGTPLWKTTAQGTMFPEVAKLASALDDKSRLIMEMLDARQNGIEHDKDDDIYQPVQPAGAVPRAKHDCSAVPQQPLFADKSAG
jgi:hypothetical protein